MGLPALGRRHDLRAWARDDGDDGPVDDDACPRASIATALGYGTDASENSLIRHELFVATAGTAGNFAATWSQLAATVGTTTVRVGSYMTAQRVV